MANLQQPVTCHCGYDIFQRRVNGACIELKCHGCGEEYIVETYWGQPIRDEWKQPQKKNFNLAASTPYK